jgi:hypothetical protein
MPWGQTGFASDLQLATLAHRDYGKQQRGGRGGGKFRGARGARGGGGSRGKFQKRGAYRGRPSPY